jgi:predicted peptidase
MKSRFESLPRRLKTLSQEVQIGEVPCLLVKGEGKLRPFIIWIHGRTADKELDPGRYLRYVRNGINVCAVDLPGHGARFDAALQEARQSLEVVMKMASEIDGVMNGLEEFGGFDLQKAAIGGVSAGGMAAILRLLTPHHFCAVVLESTVGNLEAMRDLPLCSALSDDEIADINPLNHLGGWKDIPVLAFHNKRDEWIPISGQESFINALKEKSTKSEQIEFITFERTGAPYEHIGFGRESAFVKEVQVEFVAKYLKIGIETV